ncbi:MULTISPECIES: hypothetical protein [Thermomonosporaceae]|nr:MULTISPECIES: hypothetical protein [Thermomonosporaceae]MDL4775489.1 hypothetical protein [Actinomadura xylanilytica]
MNNPLANPRRTQLDVWPEWRPADYEAEQGGLAGDAEASKSDEEVAVR